MLAHSIAQTLVLLNDTLLLEHLFADDVSLELLGVFEYDPSVAPHNRVSHRKAVQTSRAFREVVPLGSDALRAKVHQTHRMVYIKEVVLPRVLDDATLSSINSLVYFNQIDIATQLRDDPHFVSQLMSRLRTAADGRDELDSLVGLLQEFCALARNLQLKGRNQFFEVLLTAGLYDVVLKLLGSRSTATRLAALDVLQGALSHDAQPWRSRIVASDSHELANLLIAHILEDQSGGVRAQVKQQQRKTKQTKPAFPICLCVCVCLFVAPNF